MKVIINDIEYVKKVDVPTDNKFKNALSLRIDLDFGDNITIRDYLYELLKTLWEKEEDFSGKRPFGNSGWQYDVFTPLIKYGFIDGELDEFGYVENVDRPSADSFIEEMIKLVFYGENNKL